MARSAHYGLDEHVHLHETETERAIRLGEEALERTHHLLCDMRQKLDESHARVAQFRTF